MPKILRFFTLWAFLLTHLIYADTYKVASSVEGVSYYTVVQSMNDIADANNHTIHFLPLQTNGSVQNIKMLLANKADFAIVQNDIAFFAQYGHLPFLEPNDTFRIVLPLFKEPIFLLTNKRGINSLKQMNHKKIIIGSLNSGLNESAKVILNTINILHTSTILYDTEEPSIQKLLHNQVDGVFVNDLNHDVHQLIIEKKLFIVPISKNLVTRLQSTFPYFSTHIYTIGKETVPTVAVRSILITRNDMDKNIVKSITKLLRTNYNMLTFPQSYHTPKSEIFKLNTELQWHEGVEEYLSQNHIISSSKEIYNKYFWYIFFATVFGVILILFVVITLLYKLKKVQYINNSVYVQKLYIYMLQYKYILLFIFVLLIYIITIFLIKYFEHIWAVEHNLSSVFDENPLIENSLWLFIFGATGYNGEFFPNSAEGKLLVSLIPMVGVGGFFAFIGFITSDQIKKYILEAKGMAHVNFTNHILICGWNERTRLLIENLTHKNLASKKYIVIIADNIDYNPVEKYNLQEHYVKYVFGSPRDREILDKANIQEATTAIIIAQTDMTDPDPATILTVLAIEKYCLKLEEDGVRKKEDNIYTIAEIIDPRNYQIAEDALVDQIISLGDIESKVFTQSVQNPGVLKFIDEIFTYNDYNDIYTFEIQDSSTLLSKTYDEVLFTLRQYDILLLSINLESKRSKSQIRRVKEEMNLKRTVITNPIDQHEKEYTLNSKDVLIVLAKYESNVTKAIQELNR